MKKLLLSGFALLSILYTQAQCDPDYDFGESNFGVSPDPTIGESFEDAYLGVPYEDIIHVLSPTDAGDINELFAGYAIDSLSLDSVKIMMGDESVHLEEVGLEVLCNNNGDSEDPCVFLGGNQYCAAVEGTPNTFGEFPLTIHVTGYLTFLETPTPVAYSFDQYVLTIHEDMSVAENGASLDQLRQNVPHPFSGKTTINFNTGVAGEVHFTVSNLLGEVVYQENVQARRGENQLVFDGSSFESGIYLYSMETDNEKITKRMVIR